MIKHRCKYCYGYSNKLGFGSNHGDVLHWFAKYNKTMDDVRRDVDAILNGTFISSTLPSSPTTSTSATATVTDNTFKIGRIFGTDFINNEFNVLLCTTIIENGIDIPNVNTSTQPVEQNQVVIPTTVTKIVYNAFSDCIGIETIDLPEALEIIENFICGKKTRLFFCLNCA